VGGVNPIPISARLTRALYLLPVAHHPRLTPSLSGPIRPAYPFRGNLPLVQGRVNLTRIAAPQLHPYLHANISSIWLTRPVLLPQPPHPVIAFKSILQPSSATFAPSASHVHTTCVLIYEPTRTSDLLSARYVEKHSPANMTANDTRDYIVVRKNSYAKANLRLGASGAVGDGSREQTPWEGTSDLKPEGFASSHFWKRRQPKERGPACLSSNQTITQWDRCSQYNSR
jgi:hypothetical protein